MIEIIPRFEFRVFAYNLTVQTEKLYQWGTVEGREEQEVTYLITADNYNHSITVCDGRLSIQYLIQKKNGLEQWRPIFQAGFPLAASELRWELFTSLNTIAPHLEYERYDLEPFWTQLIQPHPHIQIVSVVKHRLHFNCDACRVEASNLWVNGNPIQTLAIEHEDDEIVQRLRRKLGLEIYENVSYPLALEHMMDLAPYFVPSALWSLKEDSSA